MQEPDLKQQTSVGPADIASFRLLYAVRRRLLAGYEGQHNHRAGPTMLAIRSWEGSGCVTIRDGKGETRELQMDAGTALLSDDATVIRVRSDTGWGIWWFDFIADSTEMFPWNRLLRAPVSEREQTDLEQVHHAMKEQSIWPRREATAMLLATVAGWIARDGHGAVADDPAVAVDRSLAFVQANLTRPVSVEEMAEAAGLSLPVFRRHFRQVMGLTPKRYADRLRMEAVWQVLIQGVSVKEAAERFGFSDPFHLTRAFRRIYNSTPRRLKRSIR